MAHLLLEANSTTAAAAIKADADTGALYGVDLGTTTKSAAYSNLVLLELTQARSLAVCDALPEDVDSPMLNFDPGSFTSAAPECQVWFLRARL